MAAVGKIARKVARLKDEPQSVLFARNLRAEERRYYRRKGDILPSESNLTTIYFKFTSPILPQRYIRKFPRWVPSDLTALPANVRDTASLSTQPVYPRVSPCIARKYIGNSQPLENRETPRTVLFCQSFPTQRKSYFALDRADIKSIGDFIVPQFRSNRYVENIRYSSLLFPFLCTMFSEQSWKSLLSSLPCFFTPRFPISVYYA